MIKIYASVKLYDLSIQMSTGSLLSHFLPPTKYKILGTEELAQHISTKTRVQIPSTPVKLSTVARNGCGLYQAQLFISCSRGSNLIA